MFNSQVLEVALGLTFTYLAFSLVCSGLGEYYSALLRRRENFLQHAIAFLFNRDNPRGQWLYTLFLEHPLIKGLAPGQLGRTKEAGFEAPALDQLLSLQQLSARSKSAAKRAPQYIPDTAFVNAVLDILIHGGDLFAAVPSGPAAAGALPGGTAAGGVFAATPLPPQLRAEITTTLQNLLAATESLPEIRDRAGLQAVINQGAANINNLAQNDTTEAFWRVVDQTRTAIRVEADKVAAGPTRDQLLAALTAEDQRIRGVKDNAVRVHKLTEEVDASINTLRGAASALTDQTARDSLVAALDQGKTAVDTLGRDTVTAQQVWGTVTAMLATVKGILAAVAEPEKKAGLLTLVDTETQRLANVKNSVVTLQRIRDAVNAMPPSEIRTALRALTEESGTSLDDIKAGIGNWYNDAMDRVSAWYKRHTMFILFIISIFVSFGLNIDTLNIAGRLSQDPALRAAFAQAARADFQERQARALNPTALKDEPATAEALSAELGATAAEAEDEALVVQAETPATKESPAKKAADIEPGKVFKDAAKPETPATKAETPVAKAETKPESPVAKAETPAAKSETKPETPIAKAEPLVARPETKPEASADETPKPPDLDAIQDRFRKLGVPIGWNPSEFARLRGILDYQNSDKMVSGANKLLGLLITTLALSMGGPFWFDMLTKLVAVGTAGKKPDKTLDDPAKNKA